VPLMMVTPVEETSPIRETKPDERRQQKLITLDQRVHNITWTNQVFRVLGKSMPGRGHGARLADNRL
jgi:hypothetical protein